MKPALVSITIELLVNFLTNRINLMILVLTVKEVPINLGNIPGVS